MQTHLITLAALAAFSTLAAADTPEAILKDYRTRATQATQRLNETLESQSSPIITDLLRKNDTAGAEAVATQVKAKLAGEPVASPHVALATLFAQYDGARATALQPVQKSSMARLDSLLNVAGGPKVTDLEDLTKAKAEIEEGKLAGGTLGKNFLRKNNIPKKWGYFLTQDYNKRYGTLQLNEDGTLAIAAASPATGTWRPTSNPMVLEFDIQNATKTPEKTEMIINGKEASLKRVSGTRYLRAD